MKHFTRWHAAASLLVLVISRRPSPRPELGPTNRASSRSTPSSLPSNRDTSSFARPTADNSPSPSRISAPQTSKCSGAATQPRMSAAAKPRATKIVEVAEKFFKELRSDKREVIGESLTTKAQEVLKAGKSPLAELPAPEDGNRAVRLGRPKLDDKVAEVPAQIRAAGKNAQVQTPSSPGRGRVANLRDERDVSRRREVDQL